MPFKADFKPLTEGTAVRRSIIFTVCDGVRFDTNDGSALAYHDVLMGRYTPKQATKAIRKYLGETEVHITRTQVYAQLVTMPVLEFFERGEAQSDPEKVAEYVLDSTK